MAASANLAPGILVIGAGFVARPLIRYLLEHTDRTVTVANLVARDAEAMIAGHPRGRSVPLDLEAPANLAALVADAAVVVSLVPYRYHVQIAEVCIKHRRHLVTTSYVADAMRALHERAVAAEVLILNEIGLDPGIDHLSAMRVIDRVHRAGGRVTAFRSYCGGLPAPEANTNPLGYKFSWSPRGVLLAGRNAARYLDDGRTVEIPGPDLFRHHWLVEVPGAGAFEAYFNRNSLPYREAYGIPEARTVMRCTLRNPGWCEFWYRLAALGWLDDAPRPDLAGRTWHQVLRAMVPGTGDLIDDLCALWGMSRDADPVQRLLWLGLHADQPLPADERGRPFDNRLDLLCRLLTEKLALAPRERDAVILLHDFTAVYPTHRERITSTLVEYGQPDGDSAMSRTVSLPAAIATRCLLEGRFAGLRGVQIPTLAAIYEPVLAELETLGIRCREASSRITDAW